MVVSCKCLTCGRIGKADITINQGHISDLKQPIPVTCPNCQPVATEAAIRKANGERV